MADLQRADGGANDDDDLRSQLAAGLLTIARRSLVVDRGEPLPGLLPGPGATVDGRGLVARVRAS